MLELQHISYEVEQDGEDKGILRDINLKIEEGDIFGIIGMSGAGKSTLVRCMNMLEVPTEGTVFFNGMDLSKLNRKQLREARRSMGMIFQQFNLLMQRTAEANICFPLEISGVDKITARKRAKELLELVGLADKAKAYPSQLSGGQKQRVAIAGIVAMKPKCIVLDEPTAMLDPLGRKEVLNVLHELNRKENVTIILITHYMEEVIDADYVYVMDGGKLVMDGTPRQIFTQVEMLKSMRLDVPQVTELAYELKKAGLPIKDGIIRNEELVEELKRLDK